MPMFVLTYHNRPGYTPTPETRAAWQAWFAGMGDQLADMGKPVIARTALGNCSPESTELGGYSLIQADDLEAATAIAKGCPHLERSGGVQVGLLGEISDLQNARA
jgi:YCII-related domain